MKIKEYFNSKKKKQPEKQDTIRETKVRMTEAVQARVHKATSLKY